jgi:hypothetical protein
MVNVLYQIDGNAVKAKDVRDPTMLGAGRDIPQILNPLQCPRCKNSRHITVVISGGRQFAVRAQNPCHSEFFEVVKTALTGRPPYELNE